MRRSPRGSFVLAAAVVCVMVGLVGACSTNSSGANAPRSKGPETPGATACEVQGYFDESEGGACPDGTCPVDAFDTNGGRLACCTSIASGPGLCLGAEGGAMDAAVDATAPDAADAGTPDAIDASASDATDASLD
jgi:hypothetical protein